MNNLMDTPKGNPPGYAVAALINLDILLFFTLVMMTLPLVVNKEILAKVQGVVTLVVGILVILNTIVLVFKIVTKLFVMVGMFLAIPFGTILYMILFGSFNVEKAAAILTTLMFLKIVMSILLIAANEKFLMNLGLVLLVGTSMIAMLVISFLHNMLPVFLVSITDCVAAIIVCVLAIIWAVILIVGGLIGAIKALKI